MPKTIETERLTLRILNASSSAIVLDYYVRNKSFLEEWEPYKPKEFYTLQMQQRMLDSDILEMARGNSYRFWIFLKGDTSKTIGCIALNNIVYGSFMSCFMGYKIDKDYINNGYMTEAARAVINFAFNTLKLHRVQVSIMPRNVRSLRVAEKLGLTKEGFSPKYLKINNVWEDHIHMVAINDNCD